MVPAASCRACRWAAWAWGEDHIWRPGLLREESVGPGPREVGLDNPTHESNAGRSGVFLGSKCRKKDPGPLPSRDAEEDRGPRAAHILRRTARGSHPADAIGAWTETWPSRDYCEKIAIRMVLRPGDHLFHFSLRSRCTATLAGLRTLRCCSADTPLSSLSDVSKSRLTVDPYERCVTP